MVNNTFLVYDFLFYMCISIVMIVMFLNGSCFRVFIYLVFLMDGLLSLLFYIQGFFWLKYFFNHVIN